MKRHAYRFYFRIRIYCGGIISYINAHTTIIGIDENDAKNHFKEILRIGKADWDELKDAINILKIEQEL